MRKWRLNVAGLRPFIIIPYLEKTIYPPVPPFQSLALAPLATPHPHPLTAGAGAIVLRRTCAQSGTSFKFSQYERSVMPAVHSKRSKIHAMQKFCQCVAGDPHWIGKTAKHEVPKLVYDLLAHGTMPRCPPAKQATDETTILKYGRR